LPFLGTFTWVLNQEVYLSIPRYISLPSQKSDEKPVGINMKYHREYMHLIDIIFFSWASDCTYDNLDGSLLMKIACIYDPNQGELKKSIEQNLYGLDILSNRKD